MRKQDNSHKDVSKKEVEKLAKTDPAYSIGGSFSKLLIPRIKAYQTLRSATLLEAKAWVESHFA